MLLSWAVKESSEETKGALSSAPFRFLAANCTRQQLVGARDAP